MSITGLLGDASEFIPSVVWLGLILERRKEE